MTTAEIARRVKQLEERVGYREVVFVTSVSSTVARPMDPNVNVVGEEDPPGTPQEQDQQRTKQRG